MGAYAMRRLLWIPVTLLLTTIVVFLLVRFIPGDIVDTIQAQMVDNGGAGAIDRPRSSMRWDWMFPFIRNTAAGSVILFFTAIWVNPCVRNCDHSPDSQPHPITSNWV